MERTVLVTGAGRGIGLELARVYARAGYNVIATVRDRSNAQSLADIKADGSVEILELDVVDGGSVAALGERLAGRPLDILINNAGATGGERQSLDDMDYEAWIHALEVNALAPFRIAAALLPNLQLAGRGAKLLTLTSQMGSLNQKSTGQYAYRTSKAAANKVMQVLAADLESHGIIVCPLHPGWVRTEMGGPAASISAEESAHGLFQLIERLTMADSGRFWTWEGAEHPW